MKGPNEDLDIMKGKRNGTVAAVLFSFQLEVMSAMLGSEIGQSHCCCYV